MIKGKVLTQAILTLSCLEKGSYNKVMKTKRLSSVGSVSHTQLAGEAN